MKRPKRQASQRRTPAPRTVINVPRPRIIVRPAARHSQQVRGWARAWSVAKVAGPAITAIAALVISLLTYNDQHDADKLQAQSQAAANAAAEEHDAGEVSWSFDVVNGTITIVNASTSLITSVEVNFYAEHPNPRQDTIDYGPFDRALGELPVCSETTFYAPGSASKGTSIAGYIFSVSFIDRHADAWWIDRYGRLTRQNTRRYLAEYDTLGLNDVISPGELRVKSRHNSPDCS